MNIYDFSFTDSNNNLVPMSNYKDKVLLIINVASKCGFTKQYDGLEKLYKKHKDKGFEIIAFPCNQFGGQEPGTIEEIQEFCKLNYDVTFTIASKIEVNGENADPIYKYLTQEIKKDIAWNFEKCLIDRYGKVVNYAPHREPHEMEEFINFILTE